jgi:K+-sensing histidine kinase KdpD
MAELNQEPAARYHWLVRYVCTLLATVGALLIRQTLEKMVGGSLPPFVIFLPTIMTVALIAGMGPGIFATFVSAVLADYFFIFPIGFGIGNMIDIIGLFLFVSMGIYMSVVAGRYLNLRKNLEKTVAERSSALQDANEELASLNEELAMANEELTVTNEELQAQQEEIQFHLEELGRKNDELNSMNRTMVGRELRMIELKGEVNELCSKAGESPRYAMKEQS